MAPFLVEFSGLVPPAYSFANGDLVLHARSLRLPEGPTIAGLIYLSASFLVLLCICLLYTSDAADERSSVDLGGRRIIKKNKTTQKKTKQKTKKKYNKISNR